MKIAFITIIFAFALSHSLAFSDEAADKELPSKLQLLQLSEKDHYLGDPASKVIFIEYSSLVCHHCADFHLNILPKIKETYVDSDKVLYIRRDFATNKAALTAAALANCSGNYFPLVEALFLSQNSWAFSNEFEKALLNIAKLSGVEKDQFNTCLGNEEIRNALYIQTYQASKVLDVNATPVFFINGEKLEGSLSYDIIASKIEKKLKAH